MKYFRESVARRLLVNEEFNNRYCRVLRSLVVIHEGNRKEYRAALSAEDQYLFDEKRQACMDWCIREIIRLNKFSCDNLYFVKFIDQNDKQVIQLVLAEFFEMSLGFMDQLLL